MSGPGFSGEGLLVGPAFNNPHATEWSHLFFFSLFFFSLFFFSLPFFSFDTPPLFVICFSDSKAVWGPKDRILSKTKQGPRYIHFAFCLMCLAPVQRWLTMADQCEHKSKRILPPQTSQAICRRAGDFPPGARHLNEAAIPGFWAQSSGCETFVFFHFHPTG
jgi:hypothetical protein